MNLAARIILETAGFVGPAERALNPLRRLKAELAGIGREADRVGSSGGGGGRLALPAGAGVAGVAATVAPAAAALAVIRTQTALVAQEMRKASAPIAEMRAQFRGLALEAGGGGGGGGRRMINVTPIAAMRAEMILANRELRQHLALPGGAAAQGVSRMVYAPIGRRINIAGQTLSSAPVAGGASGIGGRLLGLGLGAGAAAGGLAGAVGSMKSASQMEDAETSFATLLGSMDAAKARMQELAEFAEKTPFELPEVTAASRVLETLTRGAISTGEGLRMVGDVAANTGQPFNELAVWIGRTYDGLQNGRPVGEALLRLQELGVMSGDTRSKIEELQAEGERGPEVWNVAAASFGRFAGEMERRSATTSGRLSNLKDAVGALGREIGGPLNAMINEPLKKTADIIGDIAIELRNMKRFWREAFEAPIPAAALPPGAALPAGASIWMQGGAALARVNTPAAAAAEKPHAAPTIDPLSEEDEKFLEVFDVAPSITQARNALKELSADFAEIRDQRILNNPFSDDAARERALLSSARRQVARSGLSGAEIAPGITAPMQSVDEALELVEAEMKLVEGMREHNELAEGAEERMAKLLPIYKELVALSGQMANLTKERVDRALKDFFGGMDGKRAQTQVPVGDRLARIGGFSGNVMGAVSGLISAGGPAAAAAQQTAVNTTKMVGLLERVVQKSGASYS